MTTIESLIRQIVQEEINDALNGKEVTKEIKVGDYKWQATYRDQDDINVLLNQVLSVRAYNVLKYGKPEVKTISHLKRLKTEDLMGLHNCGKKTRMEIMDIVDSLNE